MRKIEQQMIEAIKSETDWKSGNTKVINFYNEDKECVVTSVFLHDIFDGGWQSNTTKSRLNALCSEFCVDGERVFQKDFAWYVKLFVGAINGESAYKVVDFSNGFVFA